MSDGWMVDPIRPGENNNSASVPTRDYSRNNQSSSAGKIVLAIILIVFVFPFVMAVITFITVWKEGGSELINEIRAENRAINGYEITDEQQASVSRIFSVGRLYDNGGPKEIKQSDCRHFKNAVTSYFNYKLEKAEWYDDTYCEVGSINLQSYFTDFEETTFEGGAVARIDVSVDGGTCLNVAFANNLRNIINVKKTGTCTSGAVTIRADGVSVPEIKPQQFDTGTGNEEEPLNEPEGESNNLPVQKSHNVLRS